MRKCSLFGFLTYALEFFDFVVVALVTSKLDGYDISFYFTIIFFGLLYNIVSIKKAKNNDLCIQAKMKSKLVEPNSPFIISAIYAFVPFFAHVALNLNLLGDILACIITAYVVAHSLSNGSRLLEIFLIVDIRTYKIALDKGDINLVIKERKKYPEEITEGDTLELSHIAGNYYLLKNVIKQEEENDNAEEAQEKELIEI